MRNKIYRPHLSTARDARAVRTRGALRAALLSLLETSAIEQITIRDIAATAGIGYTTFFRHHATKEALLSDLVSAEVQRLVDLTLPVMDARNAKGASEALCAYVDDHRALWSTLLTGGAAAALREEFLRITMGIAATRSRPGDWPPAEVAIPLLVGGTIEVLTWWLKQANPVPMLQVAEIHHRIVVLPVVDAVRPAGGASPRRKRAVPQRRSR